MAAPTRPRAIVADIEARAARRRARDPGRAAAEGAAAARAPTRRSPRWRTRSSTSHRTRTLVALALMAAQAFFYNAIFFTYALVLTTFYGVPTEHVGWYILPFAAGNVLGPLLLGRLFDTIGRRPMIAFTYVMSGVLLALTGWLFAQGMLERARADRLRGA